VHRPSAASLSVRSFRTFGWSWSLSSIRNQVTGHLPAGRPVAGRGERCRTSPGPPLIVLSGVVVGGPEVSASLGPAGRQNGAEESSAPGLGHGSSAAACGFDEPRSTRFTVTVLNRRDGPAAYTFSSSDWPFDPSLRSYSRTDSSPVTMTSSPFSRDSAQCSPSCSQAVPRTNMEPASSHFPASFFLRLENTRGSEQAARPEAVYRSWGSSQSRAVSPWIFGRLTLLLRPC